LTIGQLKLENGKDLQILIETGRASMVITYFNNDISRPIKQLKMSFWDKLLKKQIYKNPEDDFVVTITDSFIQVEHPELKTNQIHWNNIEEIKLRNTDSGPWMPDIWLTLIGKDEICLIPQGAKGYAAVYDIVSKYEGFNFENAIKSTACTDNAEFHLWTKK